MALARSLSLALAMLLASTPASAADKLTVILDWFVNPDHGPLIVAREKGFFAAEGLEVELIAPADPNDPPKLVAARQADLAVSYQPQLHLQVAQGLPLVRVGTLVATPLNSLVVLADGPVGSVADLKGRKIGFSVGGFEDALLGAMLERHGLVLDDVELVNVNFSLSPALLAGQVDAVIGAFRNFELNQMDIVGRSGRAFYPEEEGVPTYDELILLANHDDLGRPELRRFLTAVEAATAWLLNHPDEAWAVFKGVDPALDDELNRRAWGDTLRRFAHSPAALDQGRYRRFGRFLSRTRPGSRPAARCQLRRRPVPGAEPMTVYVAEGVDRIRREGPLVHNVTNLVAMTLSANVLIAAGASPIMSAAPEEAGDLAGLSGALVVNIGTLTHDWVEGARAAVRGARIAGRPWVLDPVGVGVTAFRRDTTRALIAQGPRVIRGNASEIMALAGGTVGGKGVDSMAVAEAAAGSATALARDTGAVVAVTGPVDLVTDGTRTLTVANGHELLTRTTASGCALTALIGAWVAVIADPLEATAGALAAYGVAAELAAPRSAGCGYLRPGPSGRAGRAGRRHRVPSGADHMSRRFAPDLYLVTDRLLCARLGVERVVSEAVAGGVTMVQLRDDVTPAADLVGLARRLVELLAPTGVPLIVNNRIEIAVASGAAGAHVGQADASPAEVRCRLGPTAMVGLSITGTGAAGGGRMPTSSTIWASARSLPRRTKADAAPPMGLGGLAAMRAGTALPIVAIGGIDRANAAAVIAAGADGIAVVSAVCGAADPMAASRDLALLVAGGQEHGRVPVTAGAWLEERFTGAALDPRLGWHCPPERSQAGPGGLVVETAAGTDFWQGTHYGFRVDNGHALLAEARGAFVLETRVRVRADPPVRPGRADGAARPA